MLKGVETFTSKNDSENQLTEAIRAELYTRIYKWTAEDFTSVKDQKDFIEDLLNWAKSVERRLSRLGYAISSHTHPLVPHWHAGAGPQMGGMTTMPPTNPTKLTWPQGTLFKMIKNTTGAKSNLDKNKIVENREPTVGDVEFGKMGRELVIPVLKGKTYNDVIVKKV